VVPSLSPGLVQIFSNSVGRLKSNEILAGLAVDLANHDNNHKYDFGRFSQMTALNYKCENRIHAEVNKSAFSVGMTIRVENVCAKILPLDEGYDIVNEIAQTKCELQNKKGNFIGVECKGNRDDLASDIFYNACKGKVLLAPSSAPRTSFFVGKYAVGVGEALRGMFKSNKIKFVYLLGTQFGGAGDHNTIRRNLIDTLVGHLLQQHAIQSFQVFALLAQHGRVVFDLVTQPHVGVRQLLH